MVIEIANPTLKIQILVMSHLRLGGLNRVAGSGLDDTPTPGVVWFTNRNDSNESLRQEFPATRYCDVFRADSPHDRYDPSRVERNLFRSTRGNGTSSIRRLAWS